MNIFLYRTSTADFACITFALGKDLLIANMNRKNDYSKQNLFQCTYWHVCIAQRKWRSYSMLQRLVCIYIAYNWDIATFFVQSKWSHAVMAWIISEKLLSVCTGSIPWVSWVGVLLVYCMYIGNMIIKISLWFWL